jgi:hypothetical protein
MKTKSSRRTFLQAGLSLPAAGLVIPPISLGAAFQQPAEQPQRLNYTDSGKYGEGGNQKGQSKFEQYIVRDLWHKSYPEEFHAEVTKPALALRMDEMQGATYSPFTLSWVPITEAFLMAPEPHVHDWDEFLMFIGGDTTNLLDLGGEVEFSLGDDPDNMEKFVFTTPTVVHLTKGLWHCPLNFKRVDDPAKPVLFTNLMFTTDYTMTRAKDNK